MWYLRTAYSVISVFGASVPLGRLLIVWIAGLARQLPGVQDGPSLLLSGSPPLPEPLPDHLHVRQACQPRPRGEDVGAGSDLAGA